MSGICGVLTSEVVRDEERTALAAMLDALSHRGKNPPRQGHLGDKAIMGYCGSEAEGDSGKRPFVSPCGRYLVVLDGRL